MLQGLESQPPGELQILRLLCRAVQAKLEPCQDMFQVPQAPVLTTPSHGFWQTLAPRHRPLVAWHHGT